VIKFLIIIPIKQQMHEKIEESNQDTSESNCFDKHVKQDDEVSREESLLKEYSP